MKATTLLKDQHTQVNELFSRLGSEPENRPTLLEELCSSLAAHMAIEERVLYPTARTVLGLDLPIEESYEEHAMAKIGLQRLMSVDPQDVSFVAKVSVLRELIQSHVEEEERVLFPMLEEQLGEDRLQAMGEDLQVAFDEAMDQDPEDTLADLEAGSRDRSPRRSRDVAAPLPQGTEKVPVTVATPPPRGFSSFSSRSCFLAHEATAASGPSPFTSALRM
jgi:iron-sulfur cluster repair protein YtfE (RIC family)